MTAFIMTAKRYNHASPDIFAVSLSFRYVTSRQFVLRIRKTSQRAKKSRDKERESMTMLDVAISSRVFVRVGELGNIR